MPQWQAELKSADMKPLLDFLKQRNIRYYLDADIKPYLSIRMGGRIKLIVLARKISEFIELFTRISESEIPRVLIGGGTNVVFSDGYSPIAVIVNRTSGISKMDGNRIRVNSGVSNRQLIKWCLQNNIGGLEFLAGIPGTIGGAAAVNAGAFGKSLSDVLDNAEIIDETNSIRQVEKEFFQYGYRHSVFRTGDRTILSVTLSHQLADRNWILEKVSRNLQYREKNHPPYNQLTAGCFFKNPILKGIRTSAGKIIENADLKGLHYKNLKVSDKHANFIMNTGNATLQDIHMLEAEIIDRVIRNKGPRLEREVIYIASDGKKY